MKDSLYHASRWALAALLTLVFAASALVRPAATLERRQLSHTWLTCNTLIYARNWCREGAAALRFQMVGYPPSVETPELKDRQVYASYPPGPVFPVWLAAKAAGVEPSLALIVALNLGLHFLIALGLAGLASSLLAGQGAVRRLAAGAGAGLFYLCAGAPFQYHWSVYFSDTLVLLPVVLLLGLESLRIRQEARPGWVRFAIPAVIFCGTLTDPLMPILAAVLSVWRLIAADPGERGKAFRQLFLELALPVALALGLFFLQLLTGGLMDNLADAFRRRTLMEAQPEKAAAESPVWKFISFFRLSDLLLFLIPCGVAAVFRAAGRAPVWKAAKKQTALIGVLLAACAVQLLFFWNHSRIHSFSVLKLYLPAALWVGVMLAVWTGEGRWRKVRLAAAWLFFLALAPVVWRQETVRAEASPAYPFPELVRHITRTAEYRDVYLSPVVAISNMPPHLLSLTGKSVWGVKTRGQIDAILAPVRGQPCTLHFLVLDTPEIAALFPAGRARKAVYQGITEYVIDARDYPALAPGLGPLFVAQDRLWRKQPGENRVKGGRAYLVPWKK